MDVEQHGQSRSRELFNGRLEILDIDPPKMFRGTPLEVLMLNY